MNRIRPSRLKFIIFFILLVGGVFSCGSNSQEGAIIEVRFSPGGNCTNFVIENLAKAQKTILVQAYYLTSKNIADALIEAHQRGVEVNLLVDRSQVTSGRSQVRHIREQGIAVAIDQVPGIAHNKVIIIDDQYVLTGSFNWTQAAETRNAENLLLIKDAKINSIYKAAWYRRAEGASALPML